MAVMGYLVCKQCKEYTCLGKWLRQENNVGVGFWRGNENYDKLGYKTLNFLAKHVDHEILILSSDQFDLFAKPYNLSRGELKNVESDLNVEWPKNTG